MIGHAWSADATGATWEVGPPVSVPGEMRQLEVPQLVELARDRWVVLACARASDFSAARRARAGVVPETGTLILRAPRHWGSSPLRRPVPVRRRPRAPYAGRIVELHGRRWLMSWTDTVGGAFVGELADPIPLELGADGNLRVADAVP